ncbi:PAS domain-containing protein [Chryseobacterium wangxinyae]|uniref:ATP-binding protein n=1 Tax=Chryseobacterium sp. CY350 TaxID=2997336 RepID=UPI0022721C98|nr:ATP-binding protein [Chryseobacterium sp. CY350]MCY0977680.1 PAS domain-containing protein [Chryseobacterium sp. CY350]WBZ95311.1 PAS domain-containing protein [Chryseobacterium sp. CY350]
MIRFFNALGTEALLEILNQSSTATAIYTGSDINIQLANNAMLTIWGKDRSIIGKKFEDALPELKGQPFTQLLKNVWETAETYEAVSTPATLEIDGEMVTSYFDFIYQPIIDNKGEIYCILHTASDVTERERAWKLLHEKEQTEQQTNEELTALNEEILSTNEELSALNKEYTATNSQLDETNKELQQTIIDLNNSNKILEFRNRELKELNETILQLNKKLSDSEISFSNLIDQAPVATLLVKGDNFIITMINASMLELIGKDHSVIGKPLFDELPELKGQLAANMLIETYQKGKSHTDYSNPVLLNRRGSLEKGYFNFTYTPFIENGKVTGVIDMAMEVTPQMIAIEERDKIILEKSDLEETLRKSEQRLQSILETMAEGVGVIDNTGQLIYANPMAQQILGLSESVIKGRTFDDPKWQNLRLDGTPLPAEEHPMAIMMATGKPVFDHEIGVQPPDRERFYISINAAPIFDKEGNLSGGIGTFMDVTTRRMITQGKDDFISIASHELKTPVTALKASLQLLQRSHDKFSSEIRTKLLDQSIKSLDKLSHLLTDLLDTTRIEQGQLKLVKRPLIIAELFEDCRSSVIQNTTQQIIFEGDTSQTLEADHQQIGQVMVNFITNAIKYAPESDKIIIKADRVSDHEIKISVIDHGPGIPQEKVQHLFERYYRTNYHGQKFTGLGLGLYISAEIIKNHGGKIGVDTELNVGSTFWFTLPLTNE